MDIAIRIAKESKCKSRQVGAVLVKDGVLLASGYNGPPKGARHCDPCYRKVHEIPSATRLEFCRGLHAEQNAILQCQSRILGAELYCTNFPCVTCAKMLIQWEVETVYYLNEYPDELARKMLDESTTNVYHINGDGCILQDIGKEGMSV